MSQQPTHELRMLVEAVCNETITESQRERLEALLSQDAEAMDFYIRAMWLEEDLSYSIGGNSSAIDLQDFQTDTEVVESNSKEHKMSMAGQIETSRPNARSVHESWNQFLVIAAVLFGVVVGTWVLWAALGPQHQDNRSILKQVVLKEEQDTIAPEFVDQPARKNVLEDGTIVVARPGADYLVTGKRRIELKSGELYLIVAKSDQPFLVQTPQGKVRATGTRFNVSTGKLTKAAVAQGTVVMESTNGNVNLGVGEEGVIRPGQELIRRPAKRLSHLVNWAKQALGQEKRLVEVTNKKNGLIAVDPSGQEAKLSLRKYHVDVYIEDGVARTTIDQTFFNHYQWNTEGTFYFPLPPDASVSRLAMYVFGKLNEGGMVTRERGQEIYNDILYQRRDPALLEMMEGNMFKMRIFPLEGRHEKRIFLSYTQTLDELYGTMNYWFPMDHTSEAAGQLSIRVHIKDGVGKFAPQSSTHEMNIEEEGKDLVLTYLTKNVKPDQDLLLNLLPANRELEPESVEISTCNRQDESYLMARLTPNVGASAIRSKPRQWIVLNDVSGSRSRLDLRTQNYILERLIAEADDQDTIHLIDLNTFARDVSDHPIGVRSELASELAERETLKLIGATNMEAGLESAGELIKKHKMSNPHVVYLGDGVATDGKKSLEELVDSVPRKCRFVGVGVGKSADTMFLKQAAEISGGLFTMINPNEDIDWRVFDLLATLNTSRMTRVKVELLDERSVPVDAIAYTNREVVAAGESVTVTALLGEQKPKQIRITGVVDGRKYRRVHEIEQSELKTGAGAIPRLWAKRHIDELLKASAVERDEVIRLSRQFYVVTPFTSLIVLEDDKMYEEYNVERGREDHWAKYAAPAEIEVVHEPSPYHYWGWGGPAKIDSEESKVPVALNPKSIQELVDNIQLRIDPPFYLRHQSSKPTISRRWLYRACDRSSDDLASISGNLTREFLLGGLRGAVGNEAKSGSGRGFVPAGPDESNSRDVDFLAKFLDSGASRVPSRFEALAGPGLDLGRGFGGRGMGGGGFGGGGGGFRRFVPAFGQWPGSLTHERLDSVKPGLRAVIQNGLRKKIDRLNRDVQRFNQRYSYQPTQWYSGSLDWTRSPANLNRLGWDELGISLGRSKNVWGDFGVELEGRQRQDLFFMQPAASSQMNLFMSEARINQGQFGNQFWRSFEPTGGQFFEQEELMPLAEKLVEFDRFRSGFIPGFNGQGAGPGGDFGLAGEWAPLPKFNEIGTEPLNWPPGIASVLAMEFLVERIEELEGSEARTESEDAELKATRYVLSHVTEIGASLEPGDLFWGAGTWGYQVNPAQPALMTVQAYPYYSWSFDLTRYANGLRSNESDIVHEILSQYGAQKSIGKISDEARKLIVDARANFKPISLNVGGQAVHVGPSDMFYVDSTSDMELREQLLCDGEEIFHIYEELGLVARRSVSPLRLEGLRSLVPFVLVDPDSLTRHLDVELVDKSESDFTLKLMVTEPQRVTETLEGHSADTPAESNTSQDDPLESPRSMLIRVDQQGRILRKIWKSGEEKLAELVFSYETDGKVKYQLTLETDPIYSKRPQISGEIEYELDKNQSFEFDPESHVVLDLPIKKPEFYLGKLEQMCPDLNVDQSSPLANRISVLKGALKDQDVAEAIQHLRHLSLASIQDVQWRRWGQANPTGTACSQAIYSLQKRMGKKEQLGDLTLYGANGSILNKDSQEFRNLAEHPLHQYLQCRTNREVLWQTSRDTDGLVGHLSCLGAGMYSGSKERVDHFAKRFPNSPLMFALYYFDSRSNSVEKYLELAKSPKWTEFALMMAASANRSAGAQKIVGEAVFEMADQDPEKMFPIPSLDVIKCCKTADPRKFELLIQKQVAIARKTGTAKALLDVAERYLFHSTDPKFVASIYSEIEEKLGLNQEGESILNRFAMAQCYWAGRDFKQAWKHYDLMIERLSDRGVPLTPGFCASAARLAKQAGMTEKALELEEQALMLEQPFLPEQINLQSFRERYQWLWSQYMEAMKQADGKVDFRERAAEILKRASSTYQRWAEVDRDNASLNVKMADLMKLAKQDETAWEYLSTMIDKKPKDAVSYFSVGNWFKARGNLKQSEFFLEQAPQWDTANPRWIYEYAVVLKMQGRKRAANREFQKVLDGKWADGLQSWVSKARSQME